MKRREWWGSLIVRPDQDPGSWSAVRCQDFPPAKKARFLRRQRALDLYFSEESSVREIVEKTGISKPELYRLRNRALTVREDGRVWGYHVCIPGFRIKAYELKAGTTTARAGTVTRFFSQHTELFELLSEWALGRNSPDVGIVRGRRYARIWAGFKKECEKRDIEPHEVPSREAIRRLCRRIRNQHFHRGVMLEGGKQAADIASANIRSSQKNRATIPYQRVQMDGHRLDAVVTVTVNDADGTQRDLPLERLWILVIIDEASRAILGYCISLESNYTCDDVLDCIAHALGSWVPLQTPSANITYAPGAGLPSGVISNCASRLFDQLAFDNAMAHTSVWVQERIIDTVGCEVNAGRPARALSRPIVERFFRTFEEDSLHRWPSTTGSGPDDPTRYRPEAAAKRLRITLDDLELAADMAIANYNAASHRSLNGRSPLEYIRYYDERGLALPRHLRECHANRLPLYDREFSRRIAGNAKLGRRPYVTFMGANYRNESLINLIDLIGQTITLVVNVKDIRTVHANLEDGSSIGLLRADEPWLRQPHSLRTRRAILKLIKTGELPREMHNPVGDHLAYIEERAKLTRRERNRMIRQSREAASETDDSISYAQYQSRLKATAHRGRIRIDKVHSQ